MIFDLENWLWKSNFLTPPHYTNSQNSMISFDYRWFLAKTFLILYPSLENSTTVIAIMPNQKFRFWYCPCILFLVWNKDALRVMTFQHQHLLDQDLPVYSLQVCPCLVLLILSKFYPFLSWFYCDFVQIHLYKVRYYVLICPIHVVIW